MSREYDYEYAKRACVHAASHNPARARARARAPAGTGSANVMLAQMRRWSRLSLPYATRV